MPSFQIVALDPSPFTSLFALDDAQLAAHAAQRRVANEAFGFPCRVSLEDAAIGDELLLVNFEHHAVASPYRASGPIFVRRSATPAALAVGEVPPYLTRRLLSVRAYDAQHLMRTASVCEGSAIAAELERVFSDAEVAYIHLHNAKPGCFACRVERA